MIVKALRSAVPRMRVLFQLTPHIHSSVASFSGVVKYQFDDDNYERAPYEHSRITHKSNAEELISKIPVIESDLNTVRCKGVNELGLGHPVEYIQVMGKFPHQPQICKWCGLRYIKRGYLKAEETQE